MNTTCHRLFQSATLEITDWHCAGDSDGRTEEFAHAYSASVTRRGAYVRIRGRQRVVADPGTVVFFQPGEGYRVSHPAGCGDRCTVFRLTPAGAHQLLGGDQEQPRFPASYTRVASRSLLLQYRALQAARHGVDGVRVEELSIAFLNQAFAGVTPSPEPTPGPASAYAERVQMVIARRFRERLTLSAIAADVGCSPFHLSRLFTSVIGTSIHRHLMRVRLRDALDRLIEPSADDRLSTVALQSGFATHSHFTEAFRREFGAPPAAVRRRPVRTARIN